LQTARDLRWNRKRKIVTHPEEEIREDLSSTVIKLSQLDPYRIWHSVLREIVMTEYLK
jgi:hypothetical protein